MSYPSGRTDSMASPDSPMSQLQFSSEPFTTQSTTITSTWSSGDMEKGKPDSMSGTHQVAPNSSFLRTNFLKFCRVLRSGRERMFGTGVSEEIATQSPPIIRSLNQFSLGYPNLAAFKDSSECFGVYRRYGYLQSRMLLERQDELRILEEELDTFDRDNPNQLTSRPLTSDEMGPRKELFDRMEKAFHGYAGILTAAHSMMSFYRPSESEYQSVCNYLNNIKPIHRFERSYIRHKEDLVTLRPGREHAWLDRSIEYTLRKLHGPLPFLNRLFCNETTRLKSRNGDEVYYSRERINLCASTIITIMILALLIVPIYLLYHLVSQTDGRFTGKATAICIGILLVFTLAFSAVLSLFTRAKRHEILGAAAAYCAVLVVFLGNVPN